MPQRTVFIYSSLPWVCVVFSKCTK